VVGKSNKGEHMQDYDTFDSDDELSAKNILAEATLWTGLESWLETSEGADNE